MAYLKNHKLHKDKATERVVAICPQCRTRVPVDVKFCPECGADLRPKQPD